MPALRPSSGVGYLAHIEAHILEQTEIVFDAKAAPRARGNWLTHSLIASGCEAVCLSLGA